MEGLLSGNSSLSLLFGRPDLPESQLSAALAATYGSGLGFRPGALVANFVSSVDGVAALPVAKESGAIVSGKNEADRFVMGLLRCCADTLLVGAGTFRKASHVNFDAASIYPPAAAEFAEQRRRLGLPAAPQLVLVTSSGDLDVSGPAIPGAWIVTTPKGEVALRGAVPSSTRLITVASDRLAMQEVVALLRVEGARTLLTEGGPGLFGQLLAARLVDELFLTIAPALFGRFPGDERKAISEGVELGRAELTLSSVHRHASHLFLRYARA